MKSVASSVDCASSDRSKIMLEMQQSDPLPAGGRVPLGYESLDAMAGERPALHWILLNRIAGLGLDALLIRFLLLPRLLILSQRRMFGTRVGTILFNQILHVLIAQRIAMLLAIGLLFACEFLPRRWHARLVAAAVFALVLAWAAIVFSTDAVHLTLTTSGPFLAMAFIRAAYAWLAHSVTATRAAVIKLQRLQRG